MPIRTLLDLLQRTANICFLQNSCGAGLQQDTKAPAKYTTILARS